MKKLAFLLAFFSGVILNAQVPVLHPVLLASGMHKPIGITNCGDERLFINEQGGRIRIMYKDGSFLPTSFLDIHDHVDSATSEQGFLSVAFSPNYKQNGFFYVNYITGTGAGKTRISRFKVSSTDSNYVDPSSEKVILEFIQPYTNHNGASLFFGKDGYLYDTQGDGGSENDPNLYGQDSTVFLSKMLRLDVSNPDTTYVIPANNPFINDGSFRPETWAWGLRNPWRTTVDRLTGDIWIGDVGQDNYEEVDFQSVSSHGGENYGWSCREGFHVCPTCATGTCLSIGFVDPIFEYTHSNTNGCSITGGYVYRGTQFSALFGRYLFTDYCSGRFLDIKQISPGAFHVDTLQTFLTNVYASFGEDNNGELYLVARSTGNGRIFHLTESSSCNPVAFISFKDSVEGCTPLTLTALKGDTLSYQWYNSIGAINGASTYQYQPNQSGWYKVKVSKNNPGCQSMSDSVYVTVHQPAALIPCNCAQSFCTNHAPFSLNYFFSPAGGVYAGNGVSNDSIFTASNAGLGMDTIIYNYVNNAGCISSALLDLQVIDCSDVRELSDNFSFTIFPNPNNGTFKLAVSTPAPVNVDLSIIDEIGRICLSKSIVLDPPNNLVSFDLPNLSKGVYILQLKGEKGTAVKRLFVD